jgi:hypothetical protein
MIIDELMSEAKNLAKPCTYLVDDDETLPFAAVWRGSGILAPLQALDYSRLSLPPWRSGAARMP